MPKPLDVLYEDENCLLINKPAGLAVQGGKGVSISLDSILAGNYSPRPLLVHRLDRDTSGVILVAKTKAAASLFSRLMEDRAIVKQYLAICSGRPAADSGPIRLDMEIRGRIKKSETRYKVLRSIKLPELSGCDNAGEFSLLELELGTGRMHQIRRHLALTGNPILGDDKYGDFKLNKILRKTLHIKRLLLHAGRLCIPVDRTPPSLAMNRTLDIRAPLPVYFQSFLEQHGV
jgi:23S rRNA pseudouridine955/2504/2580 synthase